jgi:hypothetical protein
MGAVNGTALRFTKDCYSAAGWQPTCPLRPCLWTSAGKPLPINEMLAVLDHHNFILFQQGQQDVLQFLLSERAFIELCFHRLARRQVRKAPHKEKSVRIFDGIKGTQYFHPDFSVRWNAFGVKYLQKAGSHARRGFVRPHFDNHFDNLVCLRCSQSDYLWNHQTCTIPVAIPLSGMPFDAPNRYSHLAFAGGVSCLTRKQWTRGMSQNRE